MFKNVLTQLRKEKGLTQEELANDLKISRSALSMYELGDREPKSYKILNDIANYFNVSIDYLVNEDKYEKIKKEFEAFNGNIEYDVGNTVKKPVFGKVCAGNGILAIEDIIDYESVDEEYKEDNYFLLRVSGESMQPKLDDGDTVIVRRQTSVDSGTVGIVIIDGTEGMIKKITYDDDTITLKAFNDKYEDIVFKGREVLRVQVLGKIVESKRKW